MYFSETKNLLKNAVFSDVVPYGVTSQKTAFFIVAATKISNLTRNLLFLEGVASPESDAGVNSFSRSIGLW
jgi:hypothetical protein